ncbi:MAG: UTP--glucose-1-phosphate uridylyltransferase [Desulfobacterales bacterium]
MNSFTDRLAPFILRMKNEGIPDLIIDHFKFYYRKLYDGETGLIPESDLLPVTSLDDAETFPAEYRETGEAALPKTVIIKLNGGLGTSMGMDRAKSLLPVKNSLSFLDLIVRQSRSLRIFVPVVFMNSFSTRQDTRNALKAYPEIWGDLPLDFLQHKIPKINADDLSPAHTPGNPNLEWCPPGHGDLYPALETSGMLDTLLKAGYEYAFVSNADNLGAVMDPSLLGYFIANALTFMMETADRTEGDKKGGHLARFKSGGYGLREIAQCPENDQNSFMDIERHKYFNTNNIWLKLSALKRILKEKRGILALPMIRNRKTVDPRDPNSRAVYQLETAMGAAISVLEPSGAVRVSRNRFAPVKNTADLLIVRSDCYTLDDGFRIMSDPACGLDRAAIDLDPAFYRRIDDFEARFPFGPPSLVNCRSLTIRGDVTFGADIRLSGEVTLVNHRKEPLEIENGRTLEGSLRV